MTQSTNWFKTVTQHEHFALIISDLHLCAKRPQTITLFYEFLKELAPKAQRLYILGDFFEFWAGDDTATPLHLEIASHLKALSQKGTQIFMMRGNRDVLLGKDYCKLAGAELIPDPTLITIGKIPILLAHGDAFCTDDKHYMRYRKWANNALLQRILLSMPRNWRLKLAKKIRQSSQDNYQKNPVMVDVASSAIKKTMQHHQTKTLIHGHTHEFATHKIDAERQRIVLGDWHDTGSYVVIDQNGIQLKSYKN